MTGMPTAPIACRPPDTREATMAPDPSTLEVTGTRLGFFGSTSLLARELRAVIETRGFPALDVRLFDAAAEGTLSEFAGEALVVTRPDEDEAAGLDLAFLCGSAAEMAPYLEWPVRRGFTAIDLSGASLERGDVPLVHTEINAADIARDGRPLPLLGAPHAVSHNIATVAAAASAAAPVRGVHAVALRPVAEMGEPGIEELQRQTVSLLNFQEMPREVFGRQLAFNLVPSAGVGANRAEGIEQRLRREAARLSGLDMACVNVSSAFAPVFHGHLIHMTIAFDEAVTGAALRGALQQARGVRVIEDVQEFSAVDLAGEESVAVSLQGVEAGAPRQASLWTFCDNLRGGSALNAIRIAERVVDLRQGLSR
jgi:aspartate-semialdehyde dehydrogenase